MSDTTKIRAEVMETFKDVFRQAGDDNERMAAARAAFPGTPEVVLIEAMLDVDSERLEAWWQTVERTIDGELVKRAIADASKNPAQEVGGDSQPEQRVDVEGHQF